MSIQQRKPNLPMTDWLVAKELESMVEYLCLGWLLVLVFLIALKMVNTCTAD